MLAQMVEMCLNRSFIYIGFIANIARHNVEDYVFRLSENLINITYSAEATRLP